MVPRLGKTLHCHLLQEGKRLTTAQGRRYPVVTPPSADITDPKIGRPQGAHEGTQVATNITDLDSQTPLPTYYVTKRS